MYTIKRIRIGRFQRLMRNTFCKSTEVVTREYSRLRRGQFCAAQFGLVTERNGELRRPRLTPLACFEGMIRTRHVITTYLYLNDYTIEVHKLSICYCYDIKTAFVWPPEFGDQGYMRHKRYLYMKNKDIMVEKAMGQQHSAKQNDNYIQHKSTARMKKSSPVTSPTSN